MWFYAYVIMVMVLLGRLAGSQKFLAKLSSKLAQKVTL